MNWRTTFWLTATALLLGLFILLVERPARLARTRADAKVQLVPDFNPGSVTAIEIRTTNSRVTVVRTNGLWEILGNEHLPARTPLIETLLQQVMDLQGRSILSPAELRSRPKATSDFGLNPPTITVTLRRPSDNVELLLGVRSLSGTQVYYQVAGVPGIFTTEAGLLDRLPRTAEGWRDATLLPLDHLAFDRIRVTSPGAAFALSRSPTNGLWEMTEPRPARADSIRVGLLLRKLGLLQVSHFLSTTSAPAPEIAGLRPPRLSLSLTRGSNEVFGLAFGRALTNTAAPEVYAQRPGEADLLVVPAEAQELLRISYKDLLDRRLVRFDRTAVREVVFEGPDAFRLVQTKDEWRVLPADFRADPELVAGLFNQLATLEMLDLAKEVVTDLDLATYGLAPPAGRIVLLAKAGDTNTVLAQLETGALRDNRTFARIPGEQPVYQLNPADLDELPRHPWGLRDRAIWRFESDQVAALTARHEGLDWTLRHGGTNEWAVPPGALSELNPFALEEAVHQFGQARVVTWLGVGEARAHSLGIRGGPELVFDFRSTPALPPLRVLLGKAGPSGRRYATTKLPDGTQPVFELSSPLVDDLWREMGVADADTPALP